jgi:hypothetical protein
MSKAAMSVFVFGIYLAITAIGLMFVPAQFLAPLGFAAPTEPWIRVCGVPVIALAYYYVASARANVSWFIAASVPARFIAVASFAVLAATGLAPAKVMIFAAVDGMGAVWTRLTLKS